MAIVDYQAVFFIILIILLHSTPMNIQDLLAFFHDMLHADLITLVKMIVICTNMTFILNTKWFDITTETFPEHVSTLVLHVADKMDILSFAKEYLHINQLIKGLKMSNRFQWKYTGDDLSNNILSGLFINKLVSRNCALEQQTDAFVKDFGNLCRTVFVVVESPDIEEGVLFDILYDLPLVPIHRPSLYQDEGETKTEVMKQKRRQHFSLLSNRLETFTNSKLSTDAKRFAESGFFFCGKLDRVCCYECGIVISEWKKEDDPLKEHLNHSRDCPFVLSQLKQDSRDDNREHLQHARRNESSNRKTRLRDSLQKASPLKLTKDHQKETKWAKKSARSPEYQSMKKRIPTLLKFPGDNGIKIRDLANAGFYHTGELQRDNSSDLAKDRHEENTSSKKSARSPSYQSIEARLSTFGKFPNNNEICIRDIAQAGFYYTGMNDVVRCYSCDLSLGNWEYGDDPYKEHARYLPDCDHLRNYKGEDFIRHVQKETLHLPKRPGPPSNPRELPVENKREIQKENEDLPKRSSIVQGQSLDKEKACTNLLHTPAAQSVLELGYKDELVLAAIRKLNTTDESSLTAIQILEVIFDAEENAADLVEKNIKYESQKYQSKNVQSPDEECQDLLAENQRLKDLMLCRHCQARERNILLLPCTHNSLCHECANKNNLCPECFKPVKQRIRIIRHLSVQTER